MRKVLRFDLENKSDEAKARDNAMVVYRVPGCSYVKIPHHLAMSIDTSVFSNTFFNINHRAYPYINLVTNELEWWVDERRFRKSSQKDFKDLIEKHGIGSNDEEYSG